MDKRTFILSNDKEVNKLASSLLLIVCLIVFPALIGLNIAGVFKINMTQLAVFAIISFVLVLTDFFLAQKRMNSAFVKYLSVFISTMIVCMLATNKDIGIFLTYLFPLILSCLYYDRKLAFTAFGIGMAGLAISASANSSSHSELLIDNFL
jgi:membrane-associated HD superfamily phosphohydrolase